jgi:hypothetical protein
VDFVFFPKVSEKSMFLWPQMRDGSIFSSKALQIHGSRPDVVEALAGQCLQHLDAVFSALGEVNRWGLRDFFGKTYGGNMGESSIIQTWG